MSLPTRLVVLMAVVLVATGGAWVWRQGKSWVRRPVTDSPLPAGVYLFTSATCASCAPARAAMEASGRPYQVVEFETAPRMFDDLSVARVPALLVVGSDRAWIAYGVPQPRLLRRWIDHRAPAGS